MEQKIKKLEEEIFELRAKYHVSQALSLELARKLLQIKKLSVLQFVFWRKK